MSQVPGRNWKIAKLAPKLPGPKMDKTELCFLLVVLSRHPKRDLLLEKLEPPKWVSILVALRNISKTFAGGLWGLVDFDLGVSGAVGQLHILQSKPMPMPCRDPYIIHLNIAL